MKQEILAHLHDANKLEALYRKDKKGFQLAFEEVYEGIKHQPVAQFWQERLHFTAEPIAWGTPKDWTTLVLCIVGAITFAKLPVVLGLAEEYFYPRHLGFLAFSALTVYFGWRNQISENKWFWIVTASLVALIFINYLPNNDQSNTLILSCLHLPLFLWMILGFAYLGNESNATPRRISFLRFNGDLLVISAVIVISGIILTGITIGLFSLIGFQIEELYFKIVVISGLVSLPLVSNYILQTNPNLVSRVSPIIAMIFSPLVLVTLVIYLIAIFVSGKDPYNDRDFLVAFNALLVGVMAIILFSIAEASNAKRGKLSIIILLLLAICTIIVNGIAVSAIIYRISSWGITPNRLAVLGSNVLILVHLILVAYNLYKTVKNDAPLSNVEDTIGKYLPLYGLWSAIVVFLFPLIFGFR